jgi:hypothetical protein
MVASESRRLRYVFGLDECVCSSEKEKRDSQPLFIVPPDRTNCLRLAGNVGTGSKSLTPKLWDLPVDRFGGPTDFVCLRGGGRRARGPPARNTGTPPQVLRSRHHAELPTSHHTHPTLRTPDLRFPGPIRTIPGGGSTWKFGLSPGS